MHDDTSRPAGHLTREQAIDLLGAAAVDFATDWGDAAALAIGIILDDDSGADHPHPLAVAAGFCIRLCEQSEDLASYLEMRSDQRSSFIAARACAFRERLEALLAARTSQDRP